MDFIVQNGPMAVFVALMLTPFGLPIPEDVTLMAGGVLSAMGAMSYVQLLLVGYAGIVGSDVVAWFMGRRVGLHPQGWVAWLVGEDDIARIQRFYTRYGPWAIVIARQVPGMRFPAFFFAGASGIPLPRFLRFDCPAGLVTVSLYPWLGYTFAEDLTQVLVVVGRFRTLALSLVGVAVVLAVARIIYTRTRRMRRG